MAETEIPLVPGPQRLRTTLGAAEYGLALLWREVEGEEVLTDYAREDYFAGAYVRHPDAGSVLKCWTLDIADAAGLPLLAGLPLVLGADLLAQHRHLGFTGGLYVAGVPALAEAPRFGDLGGAARLVWVDDAA